MILTRRSFLKVLAAGTAALAGPLAGGRGIARRFPVRPGTGRLPALAASREPAGTLVRLSGLPGAGDDPALAYAAEHSARTDPGQAGRRWVMVIDLAR